VKKGLLHNTHQLRGGGNDRQDHMVLADELNVQHGVNDPKGPQSEAKKTFLQISTKCYNDRYRATNLVFIIQTAADSGLQILQVHS
jgi:hypothetical protein